MRIEMWVGCLTLALACPSLGQTSLERFERQMEQVRRQDLHRDETVASIDERVLIDYGAYLSLGYYSIDDRLNDTHVLRQYDLLGYARINLDAAQEFFVRGSSGYRDFNDQDSFDGRGDEVIDPYVDRAFYRFDLRQYRLAAGRTEPQTNLTFEAGRDLAYWGNGLVLAEVLDGSTLTVAIGPLRIVGLAGITPGRTLDFDASRPNFDHHTRRAFYGGMVQLDLGRHQPYVYFVSQRDRNTDDFAEINGIPTRFDYNSAYAGAGSTGTLSDRLSYGIEFALEGGRGLSNSFDLTPAGAVPVDQTHEPIRAAGADVRLDYVVDNSHRLAFSGEVIVASGDRDRRHTSNTFGGNRSGTPDRAFNAFGLLNTGLAFAPPVSNVIIIRAGASAFPFAHGEPWERLQVGTDVFAYWKTTAEAPLDEPTTGDRYVGFEPDFFLNWQVANDVTLAIRYGVFFPGSAIVDNDRTRQFFFVGLTYAL